MKVLVSLLVVFLQSPAPQEGEVADSVLARVPFETEGGLILVDVHIGQSHPLVFVIDSGATGAVIERDVADALGVEMGPEYGRNPSSKRAEVTFRTVQRATFRIADYEFEVKNAVAAPCERMSRMLLGRTVHGILGHGFLASHTLEVDHERRELVLHDPKTYEYEGDGAALPIEFNPKHGYLPFTEVILETEKGDEVAVDMLVDSGGSILATMGLNSPDVIDAVVPDDAPRITVQGATGLANDTERMMHQTYATRLHRAHIGPFAFERPTTSCKPDNYAGLNLFGAEVLRRFHVVFDYERKRIMLEPNSRFSDPPTLDRSGLFLVASETDEDVRRVYFVSPGTPAEEAGLRRDDLLLEIDGHPSDAQSLHETRELFFEEADLELKVRRGDAVLDIGLSTRDLL